MFIIGFMMLRSYVYKMVSTELQWSAFFLKIIMEKMICFQESL